MRLHSKALRFYAKSVQAHGRLACLALASLISELPLRADKIILNLRAKRGHLIRVFHDITCSLRLRSNSLVVSLRTVRIAIAGMIVCKPISDVLRELEAG